MKSIEPESRGRVEVGIEVLVTDSVHLIQGKRIGLVCNHTSLFPDGRHLVDSIASMRDIVLGAIFSPEHGYRGSASAGEHVYSEELDGVPVYSLYGNTRRPTESMLEGLDVLVFDMQDVGARFYTYISTMGYCMEAAALSGIPIVICDRPNPVRGDIVQGPVRESMYKSFVGLYPIPIRHGMTVAEIAAMADGEGWLETEGLDLHSIPMRNWERDMWYDDTGLPWAAPSPNIPDIETAMLYLGMCFIEGTNLSEGRGTEQPFKISGAPFVDGDALAKTLGTYSLPGVNFEAKAFTPHAKHGAANPKYENRECEGVQIFIVDRLAFNPILTGLSVMAAAFELEGDDLAFTNYLPLLIGTDLSRSDLASAEKVQALYMVWDAQAAVFSNQRKPYLLY